MGVHVVIRRYFSSLSTDGVKMLAVKVLAVFLALASAMVEEESLEGQKVYRITPQTEAEVHFLQGMFNKIDVDVWQAPSHVGGNGDVRVPSYLIAEFEKLLKEGNLDFEVMIENVERAVLAQEESNQPNAFWGGFDYNRYNTYDAIVSELKKLAGQYSSASTFSVGRTYEGRDMVGIKIGSGNKPAVWIDGGIHAREWISPATVMYFLTQLLSSGEPLVKSVLAKYNFYILPVFNADGYVYTHRGGRRARFWRKTRSRQRGGCYGADPNRNWDYRHGGAGTSSNPCSDIYHGGRGFSEIEVKQVANYLRSLGNVKAYFNVHAYSQMVLTPWGYTSTYPSDYSEIPRVARIFTSAVSRPYGTRYTYGPPPRLLYAVAGGSTDWTYAVLGIRYSYALELRDKGRYGFVLPANQIKPSGIETTNAFLASIDAMK